MEKLIYTIEDRTIAEILGKENFTTDESAILELVKNAYDAGARKVEISFEPNAITIKDSGTGMDKEDITKKWMHVGNSSKGYEITIDGQTRILSGSKGVGRFALARLGEDVQIVSKKQNCKGIIWKTDWNTSEISECDVDEIGTTITIRLLRRVWTEKRIDGLIEFLSRTYNDNQMAINVKFLAKGTWIEKDVPHFYKKGEFGKNCSSIINLRFDAGLGRLIVNIDSDEFTEEACQYVDGMDINHFSDIVDVVSEILKSPGSEWEEDELIKAARKLGDFSASLNFYIAPTMEDVRKFCYKYYTLSEKFTGGIILYRNAFSISSYEGKKDWLELGKRYRKSPAAATHLTGSWRVRENQIFGCVMIDKEKNAVLTDLSNRQGLDENIYYELFIQIMHLGLKAFERYRQALIRKINRKNAQDPETVVKPMIQKVLSSPKAIDKMDETEKRQLRDEIKEIRKEQQKASRENAETEQRHRYDLRILNVLATIGLKASSKAHALENDRNNFDDSIKYAISALEEYGMWDTLHSPEYTRKKYKNVPALLETNRRIGNQILQFMDIILEGIEKQRFEPRNMNIHDFVDGIKEKWEKDYRLITINNKVDNVEFVLADDTLQVIFDNLILNSIQQNKNKILVIDIEMHQSGQVLLFSYRDNGVGLDKKYLKNPMRILEVHESSRKDGHGLGMWILNNTVIHSGGTVTEIKGDSGFAITFCVGGEVNGKN